MPEKEIDNRFSKFGTVSFASLTHVNDFIDYLDKGKVMGTRCKDCGQYFFPPRADCYACLASNMEWFEVTGAGELISYSTLRYAPAGFAEDLPYTIALLDYNDYKVFGRIDSSIPVEELSVGMKMTTVASKTANGQLIYVFRKP